MNKWTFQNTRKNHKTLKRKNSTFSRTQNSFNQKEIPLNLVKTKSEQENKVTIRFSLTAEERRLTEDEFKNSSKVKMAGKKKSKKITSSWKTLAKSLSSLPNGKILRLFVPLRTVLLSARSCISSC